jgi:hypothetical protein
VLGQEWSGYAASWRARQDSNLLAFAALIYTVLLQRNELGLQRAELRLSREELRRSVEAQRGSEQALAEQVELNVIATLIDTYTRQLDSLGSMTSAGQNARRLQESDEQLASQDQSSEDRIAWSEERRRVEHTGGTELRRYLDLQQNRTHLLGVLEEKSEEKLGINATRTVERY